MKQIHEISAGEYGITPAAGDNTYPLLRLLKDLQRQGGDMQETTVIFESGTYHFYPDYAGERTLYISNHDEDTVKRCVFLLEELQNVTIRGEPADFIFHMPEIPFYLHKCRNLRIEGITVDYEVPIYSEAKVIETGRKRMLVEIDTEKYPIEIQNGIAYFNREGIENSVYWWLEMNTEKMAPEYQIRDMCFGAAARKTQASIWRELGEHLFEITLTDPDAEFPAHSKAGNTLILRHALRTHPCLYMADCEDIIISHVTVFHTAGMGIIAERTCHIELEYVDVKRNPKTNRIFTATADAAHFVFCSGLIHLNHCMFENQLDDPVNVHGNYARIEKTEAPDQIVAHLVHPQHKGVCIGKPGHKLRLIRQGTMLPYAETSFKTVTPINKDYIRVELAKACPEMRVGDLLENMTCIPDVHIENSVFRNNRARGLLLTTSGEVLVEHNRFEIAGAAILIEGDATGCFESGTVKHLVIRENEFVDCAYVSCWGKAPIQVTPSVQKTEGMKRFHKEMVVEKNTFRCFDGRLLYAENMERIIWRNNRVIRTDTFPPIGEDAYQLKQVNQFETDAEKPLPARLN